MSLTREKYKTFSFFLPDIFSLSCEMYQSTNNLYIVDTNYNNNFAVRPISIRPQRVQTYKRKQ